MRNTRVAKSEVLLLAHTWLFDKPALAFAEGRKKCCKHQPPSEQTRKFEFLTPDPLSEDVDPFQRFPTSHRPSSFVLFFFKHTLCSSSQAWTGAVAWFFLLNMEQKTAFRPKSHLLF